MKHLPLSLLILLLMMSCTSAENSEHELEAYLRARTLYVQGDLSGARRILESEPSPDLPAARILLARILFFQSEITEAAEVLRKIVESNPYYLDAAKWLARSYLAVERPEDARGVLIEALAVSSEDVELLILMGQSARELGEIDVAIEYFTKAAAFAPRLAEGHVELGEIYRGAGIHDEAERQFRRAAEIAGDAW